MSEVKNWNKFICTEIFMEIKSYFKEKKFKNKLKSIQKFLNELNTKSNMTVIIKEIFDAERKKKEDKEKRGMGRG